jgi:hypothetical protein
MSRPIPPLYPGEVVNWEARPAPRCYTFRNWRHSLFGLTILLLAGAWLAVGLNLDAEAGTVCYSLFPLPVVIVSLWLVFGHLLVARLEWDGVWYALTDRRLLVHRGLLRRRWSSLPLPDVVWFRLILHSLELGTVTVRAGSDGSDRLVLACIEQPRSLTDRLEVIVRDNGHLAKVEE